MRVKDAFDVLEQQDPPLGIALKRLNSTTLHLHYPLPKDKKSYWEVVSAPILLGIVGILGLLFLWNIGKGLLALTILVFGGPYLVKIAKELMQEYTFTYLSLQLSSKGGYLYKKGEEVEKKLLAYYSWGEVLSVSIKESSKSKAKTNPYYIHLQAKGSNTIRLFQEEELSGEVISYTASMLEALLAQRYRGTVPDDWRKEIEVLSEPMIVDWYDHLIDD